MQIKIYIFAIIFLTIIDVIWITINKNTYNTLVKGIQVSDMQLNLYGALIAYPLMYMGLIFFIFPLIKNDPSENKLLLALKYGGLFGFIIYGVFNATNLAMFKRYNIFIALKDTLWGTFAYFITTYVTLIIFNI
jgi:uncharacterized membrane protein